MANPSTSWDEESPASTTWAAQTEASVDRNDWTLVNRPTGRDHRIASMVNKNTIAALDGTGYGFTIAELVGGPNWVRVP